MLVAAKGMYYTASDGRAILDGTAGLWCVNAGHGRESIVHAMHDASCTLDYAPSFQMAHPASFALAARLAAMAPAGLDRVFFTNSGSESVDTALKIALAYRHARGEPERTLLVGRLRGYHGVGFGGISVGGIENNRRAYASQLLPGVRHLRDTHDPARNAFSRGQPAHGAEFADELEALVSDVGEEAIAAVIVEPVAGSTGVLVPPVGYLERLRAICDAHGILLIFDEVITAFGRVGATFAAERFGVRPDLITIAKGLTNGAVPMGAVLVDRGVADTILDAGAPGIELFHGYTYTAHPLAVAAADATLDVYAGEWLFARAAMLEPLVERSAHALRGAPHVVDIRNIGLTAAIELAPRDGAPGTRAFDAFVRCFERGVLVRVTGDVIAISPPLIIEEEEIARIFETIETVLRTLD
jgi:beta-alanine--pyruvate transaminase